MPQPLLTNSSSVLSGMGADELNGVYRPLQMHRIATGNSVGAKARGSTELGSKTSHWVIHPHELHY